MRNQSGLYRAGPASVVGVLCTPASMTQPEGAFPQNVNADGSDHQVGKDAVGAWQMRVRRSECCQSQWAGRPRRPGAILVGLGQIGPHPMAIEMRLRQGLEARETADFESPLPTCAENPQGLPASGGSARPNCRSPRSSPSGSRPTDRESRQRSNLFPTRQRHIFTLALLRTRGRSTSILPPWNPTCALASTPSVAPGLSGRCSYRSSTRKRVHSPSICVRLSMPAIRQNRSKLAPTASKASLTSRVNIRRTGQRGRGCGSRLHGVASFLGLSTPSLRLRGSNATLIQSFNKYRDIP